MRFNLNKDFFTTKILKAPTGKLATDDVFKEYFRGLYFKVQNTGSSNNMAMMNFKKGIITMYYKEDPATGATSTDKVSKTIVLNLTGNTISLTENTNQKVDYLTAINNPDNTKGDDKLYLKGGEGSVAVVELFSTPGKLEEFRANKWLINEANLVFHIDATAMKNSVEPQRIFIYNLTDGTPIVDYLTDNTSASDPKKSKYSFDGNINLEKITNGRGVTYKFRITDHIRNLLNNKESINVKLGVVVTEDIATSTFNSLKVQNDYFSVIPRASVMSPLGTILYGSNPDKVPEDKRLKLEIYYTKTN
jgi:hypothetical protein